MHIHRTIIQTVKLYNDYRQQSLKLRVIYCLINQIQYQRIMIYYWKTLARNITNCTRDVRLLKGMTCTWRVTATSAILWVFYPMIYVSNYSVSEIFSVGIILPKIKFHYSDIRVYNKESFCLWSLHRHYAAIEFIVIFWWIYWAVL